MTNETARLLKMRAELERMQREIEILEKDGEVQKDIELRDEIEHILSHAGKTPGFLKVIFPDFMVTTEMTDRNKSKASPVKKHKRPLITYQNPHNGETIKTRGANHGLLKTWKKQYGSDVVNDWVISVDNSA
ncbi:MAG: DNA binding protein [Marinospirillum sp.]|uniref:histone-like nucleoid-structuring protein, MvaT/MvaU family n=1 Tax=Marinospirillum sp. TaxID=2183934 RepID=UPI001A0F0B79|nr:histone-like nucleoid-structuring protein, MvaT/MvaU family [Marinospirillum sp.]MBE0506684.1 DNA binding protein [Marinospirillum sp.]